jgi:hypothetical protein
MIESSFTPWLVLSIVAMIPGVALVVGLIPGNRTMGLARVKARPREPE